MFHRTVPSIRKRPRVSIATAMGPAFKGSNGNDYVEARAPVTPDTLGKPDVSLLNDEMFLSRPALCTSKDLHFRRTTMFQ